MAKKLNKNVVVVLTLVSFALMIGAAALMLMTLRDRDPQTLVDKAELLRSQGRLEDAATYYYRAWLAGDNPAHLVEVGQMLFEQGDVVRAVNAWSQAVSADSGLIVGHQKLVDFRLQMASMVRSIDSWAALKDAAEDMLQADPESAFAGHALGVALFALRSQNPLYLEQAQEKLEAAAAAEPGEAEYTVDVGELYGVRGELARQKGDSAEADQWDIRQREVLEAMRARLTEPGKSACQARVALADYFTGRGLPDQAEPLFGEALGLTGDQLDVRTEVRVRYAGFLFRQWITQDQTAQASESGQQLFARAVDLLKAAIDEDPESFSPYLQLAHLYLTSDRLDEALATCEARLQMGLSRKGIEAQLRRGQMVNLMVLASRTCVAQAAALEDVHQREPLLERAQQFVDDARAELPDSPAVLSQAGKVKWMMGKDREALELLREADEQNKARGGRIDWDQKLALARVHRRLSEPGAGLQVLDEVADRALVMLPNEPSFWVLYAQLLFEAGRMERAGRIADYALEIAPNNTEAKTVKARVLASLGRVEEAEQAAVGLADEQPIVVGGKLQALDSEDTDTAIEDLMAGYRADPDNRTLLTSLVNTLLSVERYDEAKQIMQEALERSPDDRGLRRMEVVTRVDESRDERNAAMEEIIREEEDAFTRAWDLAVFYYGNEELGKALEASNEAERHLVAKDTPASQIASNQQYRNLLTRKLLIAARLDNEQAFQEVIDSAAAHDVDGAGGKEYLGQYHMFKEEAELAVQAFNEALDRQPTNARILTYLGRCYESLNRLEDARSCYQRALDSNPKEGLAHKGLAVLASREHDREEYEQHLDLARRYLPGDKWVRDQVQRLKDQDDPAQALENRQRQMEYLQENYDRARSAEPPDAEQPSDRLVRTERELYENILQTARLQQKLGQLDAADASYQQLLALRPNDQDLVVQISRYYLQTNRPERSLQFAQQNINRQKTPEERANAHIILASHYVRTDNPGMVEATLLAAADVKETFEVTRSLADYYLRLGQPRKAVMWFDKAVEEGRRIQSPRTVETMSRRIECLLHRRLNDLSMARQRVDELLADRPDDPDGFFWESEIYAREGRIGQAISSLTRFLDHRPSQTGALFRRAQYYLQLGRTVEAIADLEKIRTLDPSQIEPQLLLAREYRNSGRDELWMQVLEGLADTHPGDQHVIETLATAYILKKRYDEAERLVTAQINRSGADPLPGWFFLRGRIALMREQEPEALAEFQRGVEVAKFAPTALAELLGLYAQLNRPMEGTAYFEAHASQVQPDSRVLSQYAVLLARSRRANEAVQYFRQALAMASQRSATEARMVIEDVRHTFAPDVGVQLFETPVSDPRFTPANDRILTPLLYAVGRKDEAATRAAGLVRAATTDAERGDLLIEQGVMYQAGGDFEQARTAYEQALQYRPNDWIPLNNLAYMLADNLQRQELALPYAERAVAADDDPRVLGDTLDTLGWIYVGLGRYREAIAELSKAVRLQPENPMTHYHLGEAYRLAEQFLEAKDVLEHALSVSRVAGGEQLVAQIQASLEKAVARDSSPM